MSLDDYPAPEWTSRDGVDVPAPGAVNALAARARGLGWDVRVQCSRGRRPHGVTGKPLAVKTYWGVILSHSGGKRAAYAVRDEGTWQSVMIWGDVIPFFPLASITELTAYVDARGDVDGAWFDAIRKRHEDADTRSAERKACDRGEHPSGRVEVIGDTAWCAACGNSWPSSGDPWKRPKVGKDFAS